jgi:hypothetical protein
MPWKKMHLLARGVSMLSKCYAAFLFVSALPLLAHHQFSSEFDKGKAMSLSGTVTRVDWAKPHGHIYLTVKNQSGKNEQWKLEIATPAPRGVPSSNGEATISAPVIPHISTSGRDHIPHELWSSQMRRLRRARGRK